MKKLAFALVLVVGCSDSTEEIEVGDDHASDRLVLEGPEIGALLGDDAVSDPIQSHDGFRRLGLLWDATITGALEVRTSFDGLVWTDWRSPEIVSAEEGAHAGHVDAVLGIGEEGSIDSDPRAFFYQLRAPSTLPTFVVVEPLPDIPALITEELQLPEEQEELGTIYADVRTTPIGSVKIHTRADWGARAPRCASSSMTPNRATIHHTVTPTNDSMSAPARLRQIQSFHMFSRGWCDIGYNYLISRDGRVWRARGPTKVGAHVSNANTGNIGISVMGTYTSTAPTATQMCNAAKLLRRLSMDFGGVDLNRTDVKGHRQYGGTVCPGNALYNRIDLILRKARGGCNVN